MKRAYRTTAGKGKARKQELASPLVNSEQAHVSGRRPFAGRVLAGKTNLHTLSFSRGWGSPRWRPHSPKGARMLPWLFPNPADAGKT